ncbi:hypothetical protein V8C86DRAFT_2470494 [Haematococcus lacustris]
MAGQSWQGELEVALAAARAAGDAIRRAFRQDKTVESKKNASDLVTETDVQCEQLVLAHIRAAFPTHQFIGEEQTAANGGLCPLLTDEPTWMCDPLDGTTNFVHGFPFVCVSIGLAVNRQVVVGVVYNPVLEELFSATLGGGAYLNGAPIRVSHTQDMAQALLVTEVGVTRDPQTFRAVFARVEALAGAMRSVRCCGSCALNLCSVACGRCDAFYEIGFGGCWDVAAGSLVVREAGGEVLDPAGGRWGLMSRRVLAANKVLGQQVARVLKECPVSDAEPGPAAPE